MLSGENGLLQKATKAKLSTEEKQELESLQLAINSALIEEKGKISTDSIQKGIDEFLGYGTLNGEGPWEYIGKRNLYNIDNDL